MVTSDYLSEVTIFPLKNQRFSFGFRDWLPRLPFSRPPPGSELADRAPGPVKG